MAAYEYFNAFENGGFYRVSSPNYPSGKTYTDEISLAHIRIHYPKEFSWAIKVYAQFAEKQSPELKNKIQQEIITEMISFLESVPR